MTKINGSVLALWSVLFLVSFKVAAMDGVAQPKEMTLSEFETSLEGQEIWEKPEFAYLFLGNIFIPEEERQISIPDIDFLEFYTEELGIKITDLATLGNSKDYKQLETMKFLEIIMPGQVGPKGYYRYGLLEQFKTKKIWVVVPVEQHE